MLVAVSLLPCKLLFNEFAFFFFDEEEQPPELRANKSQLAVEKDTLAMTRDIRALETVALHRIIYFSIAQY